MVGTILGVRSRSWAGMTGEQRCFPENRKSTGHSFRAVCPLGPSSYYDRAFMRLRGGWQGDGSLLDSDRGDNAQNEDGATSSTGKELKDESEASKANRLAIEHLKREIALVTLQIEVLGPAPTSLTFEHVLSEMVNELNSSTFTASFERTIYSTLCDRVKSSIDDAKAELMRDGCQIQSTYVDSVPTSSDVAVKTHLESAVVEAASDAIDACVTGMKRAFRLCICSSNSTLRLGRFELLGDFAADIIGEFILANVEVIKKAACKAVKEHFHKRLGCVYNWADIDDLIRAMYEIALINFWEKNEPSNLELSSSLQEKYSMISESQFLAESSASERAKLTQRKISLITALKELEQF